MIPPARDLWTKIKLSGFCQPVWNRGPGNSEPQQGTLDQEAGQGQGVTGRWVLDRSASTASSWFRIPRESKNVLCYFPFLDPIKIMSLLANKKKKEKKSQVPVFWATLFWDCKQVKQPSNVMGLLKGTSSVRCGPPPPVLGEGCRVLAWPPIPYRALGCQFLSGGACPSGRFLSFPPTPQGSLASFAPCMSGLSFRGFVVWKTPWLSQCPSQGVSQHEGDPGALAVGLLLFSWKEDSYRKLVEKR